MTVSIFTTYSNIRTKANAWPTCGGQLLTKVLLAIAGTTTDKRQPVLEQHWLFVNLSYVDEYINY